jgi:amphi-Trp domain-containing protein
MSEETVHESTGRRSRGAIASYFRRVADALDGGEPLPVGPDGAATVDPPAEVDLEAEVEREGDNLNLEIELEWPEADGGVDTDATGSAATFELYRDKAGKWRWRLRHDNSNIVADSGEGYSRKIDAKNGIESVKRNAAGAAVAEEGAASED